MSHDNQVAYFIADDVVREALAVGGSATILAPEDAQVLIGKLWEKYTTLARPGRVLWEHLGHVPSIHDPEGWRKAETICGEGDTYMLIEDSERQSVVWLSSAELLTPVLSETISFVFYLFDAEQTYLVCFNDHDMLIGAGAAAPKIIAWAESP
jgi:hypothetical protein